jgi:hypothetical protein
MEWSIQTWHLWIVFKTQCSIGPIGRTLFSLRLGYKTQTIDMADFSHIVSKCCERNEGRDGGVAVYISRVTLEWSCVPVEIKLMPHFKALLCVRSHIGEIAIRKITIPINRQIILVYITPWTLLWWHRADHLKPVGTMQWIRRVIQIRI